MPRREKWRSPCHSPSGGNPIYLIPSCYTLIPSNAGHRRYRGQENLLKDFYFSFQHEMENLRASFSRKLRDARKRWHAF